MARRKSKVRRQATSANLTITSLMDTMTIILVFLLMNFGSDEVHVEGSDDLHLPSSTADVVGRFTVNVVVSRRDIAVDGERVVDLALDTDATGAETLAIPETAKEGERVVRLYDALRRKVDAARTGPLVAQEGQPEVREILLQVDRRMPFHVVRDVLSTAADAGFGSFRFVVISTTAG